MTQALNIQVTTELFAICRFAPNTPMPPWARLGSFVSMTRTAEELSLVCDQNIIPIDVACERNWCALKVVGPLDFALTGILASLAVPLAETQISIFAISTYDTDYILVKAHQLAQAVEILRAAGHRVIELLDK